MRNHSDDPEKLAKLMARMAIYLVESEIKLTKAASIEIVTLPGNVIMAQSSTSSAPIEIVKLINSVFLGELKTSFLVKV